MKVRKRRPVNWLVVALAAAVAILIPLVIWSASNWVTGSNHPRMDLTGTTNDGVRTRIIELDPPR